MTTTPSVSFQICALAAEPFAPLFELSDHELAARGARRETVAAHPGAPCRVSLVDAAVGETVLLLPFAHQEAASPYRASGPVYVRAGAAQARPAPGEVPEVVRRRLLSVRAYDAAGTMRDADVVEGRDLETAVSRFFSDPRVAYLHLHNARPGCYACRVDRVAAA